MVDGSGADERTTWKPGCLRHDANGDTRPQGRLRNRRAFHTISAPAQGAGIAVASAALLAWAAIGLARGKRATAALAGTAASG
ncbi:hypothetical protein I552_6706 [Mycobacterium xenopi 3993]|nr:hypothetical protein I552_6706 [Mycobacterium xenopi 3993]